MDYLDIQITSFPDQAPHFTELRELCKNKLWHQLSQLLLKTIDLPFFQQGDHLVRLRENFVSKFEKKIKPLDLVVFTAAASRLYPDSTASIKFLETTLKIVEEDTEASVLCKLHILLINIKNGKIDESKSQLDDLKTAIDAYPAVLDSRVHSIYYQSAAEYHKAKNASSDFFQNSLLYLAYTPIEQAPIQEQRKIAYDLALAALIGNIYSFGELLQNPILNVLNETEHKWLPQLLQSFNQGDIRAFQQASEQKGLQQEIISKNNSFLNQKIRIMSLIEMVFSRSSDNRTLSFTEISQTCQLPENQVELLLMKAFSIKVLKGTIDEVEHNVRIKWVQPRVLDKNQIAGMRDRLAEWSKKVDETARFIQNNAQDILREQ